MKNDALYDYVKSQLEKGISADDLFDEEKEKKEKEEAQKKVQEELKKRAEDDFYNAYVKYFNAVYPSNKLPQDAKKLFKTELDFIDYMMTGKAKDYNDDLVAKIFKNFF